MNVRSPRFPIACASHDATGTADERQVEIGRKLEPNSPPCIWATIARITKDSSQVGRPGIRLRRGLTSGTAENGAVLFDPAKKQEIPPAEPPPPALVERLPKRMQSARVLCVITGVHENAPRRSRARP
jgi:hypothetical protein